MPTYRCVFRSQFGERVSHDRHLNVPAHGVLSAITMLKNQMQREKEELVKIIAAWPLSEDRDAD